jgi:hypothetical protein
MPRDPDFDDDDEEVREPSDADGLIRHLRKQIRQQEKTIGRLHEVEKKAAFRDAGIDTSKPLGAYFAKNFSGDFSDVTALRGEAEALGVPLVVEAAAPAAAPEGQPAATAAAPTEGVPAAAAPASNGSLERQVLAEGAAVGGTQQAVDPHKANLESARKVITDGGSQDKGLAAFIGGKARILREGATQPVGA